MERRRVLVATNNAHKLEELRAVFRDDVWEFVTLGEAGIESDPEEIGATFTENARIKAAAAFDAARAAGERIAVLADDSGLEVEALFGRPGVFSSRYAGEDATDATNNTKLLHELKRVPFAVRHACFRTVLVFLDEQGSETVAEGRCEGMIATEEVGTFGFGYDPLFLPAEVP